MLFSLGTENFLLAFSREPLLWCIGLSVGMLIGMAIGISKDRIINEQLKAKGYTILEIVPKDTTLEEYEVKITDKNEEIYFVTVSKADMEAEEFEVGDLVYMDEDGDIEQVIDKDDRE